MTKINWLKIIGNAGFSFATALSGIITFDYLIQSGLPLGYILGIASIVAGLQGLVAFFKELASAAERNPRPTFTYLLLSHLVLF